MSGLTAAVVFALLPALGNFAGGLLAELVPLRPATLSYALHAATGVVLAVVGLELMPEALAADAAWVPILAFVAGALFFIAADHTVDTITTRVGGDTGASPWMIYFGVAIDLFSDGLMIGTGTTIASTLALLLAIGQVPADVPEGFAVIANFRARGVARRKRLLFAAALAVPVLVGAVFGYLMLRGASELTKVSLLAFTGGVLTTVVVEEIVPEAHREGGARFAAVATVVGFALFAAISRYVG